MARFHELFAGGGSWENGDFARPKKGNNPFKLPMFLVKQLNQREFRTWDERDAVPPAPTRSSDEYKEARLAAAMIWQAKNDLEGALFCNYSKNGNRFRNVEDAIQWILSDRGPDEKASFLWCCGKTGWPPHWVRGWFAAWCAFGCQFPDNKHHISRSSIS